MNKKMYIEPNVETVALSGGNVLNSGSAGVSHDPLAGGETAEAPGRHRNTLIVK